MRNESKLTLLSVFFDSLIMCQSMVGSTASTAILAVRLMLFAVTGLLVMEEQPLWRAAKRI